MNLSLKDILALVMLAEAVGTIVLAGALVALYWRSPRLRHILPVAASYCWIAAIATVRAFGGVNASPTWSLLNIVAAFALGNVGLLVLLSDTWPRRGKP
jgi:hypothetical protein